MSKATLASLFALALSGATMGCSPEVPAMPTYTRDVQPILAAHCARCHSADFTPVFDPISGTEKVPTLCHFDTFANATANACAALSVTYITAPDDAPLRMPKKPSEPLNDWEIDVLTRWAKAPVE